MEATQCDLRDLFENAPAGFLVTDLRGVITLANRCAREALHLSPDDVIGRQLPSLVSASEREGFRGRLERLPEERRFTQWDIPLELDDGTALWIDASVSTVSAGSRALCWVLRDATARRDAEAQRSAKMDLLRLLVEDHDLDSVLGRALAQLKSLTGCEALAIRLREGDDFPYFTTVGFDSRFVELESKLCSRDAHGEMILDDAGEPVLECMCGNVIRGTCDPTKPFFTLGGSFWTNSTSDLLRDATEEDLQGPTRNRCNADGYESVALVPLRANGETFGLIQFNDSGRNCFTREMIELLEELAGYVAAVLS